MDGLPKTVLLNWDEPVFTTAAVWEVQSTQPVICTAPNKLSEARASPCGNLEFQGRRMNHIRPDSWRDLPFFFPFPFYNLILNNSIRCYDTLNSQITCKGRRGIYHPGTRAAVTDDAGMLVTSRFYLYIYITAGFFWR